MKKHVVVVAVAALAFIMIGTAEAGSIKGPVHVLDGDTVRIKGQSLDLIAVDAPSLNEALGGWSRQQLSEIVDGRDLVCIWSKENVTDRPLATCMPFLSTGNIASYSINELMVATGAAFAAVERDQRFVAEEWQARRQCAGVWADITPFCQSH